MLTIKQMQYLDAIYRHRSITGASEELYVSQPAISHAVAALERSIGGKLLTRGPKGVEFTPAGERLMPYIRRTLDSLQETEEMVEEIMETSASALRLGIAPTAPLFLLAKICSDFIPRWPKADITIDEGFMEDHIRMILEDGLDIAYNALPAAPVPGLRQIPVVSTQIRAVLQPDHPLARYERIPIAAFHGESIVMPDERSVISRLARQTFAEENVIPHVVAAHQQVLCMLQMVRYGNYVGLINADPGMQEFSLTDQALLLRPLEIPLSYESGFIVREDKRLSRVARALVDFTRETIAAEKE